MVAAAGYQSNWVDILQTSFMRHAFVGGTLVVVASGLLGYFVKKDVDSSFEGSEYLELG